MPARSSHRRRGATNVTVGSKTVRVAMPISLKACEVS
jgi:hypothetical protein